MQRGTDCKPGASHQLREPGIQRKRKQERKGVGIDTGFIFTLTPINVTGVVPAVQQSTNYRKSLAYAQQQTARPAG